MRARCSRSPWRFTETGDYTAEGARTVIFAAGDSTAALSLPLDESGSRDGTITAEVAPGTFAVYGPGTPGSATLAVKVFAPAMEIGMTGETASVTEGGQVSVDVVASSAAGAARPSGDVPIKATVASHAETATSGADFDAVSEEITFDPSELSLDGQRWVATRQVTVTTTEDTGYEGDETFGILLQRTAGRSGAILIVDATPREQDRSWEAAGSDGIRVTIGDNEQPPGISSVQLTSEPGGGDTYAIGDTITATVTFSAAVDVVTTGGTPSLGLDIGTATQPASCAAGMGVTAATCTYTVAENDSAAGGIRIGANAFSLNGGAVTVAGNGNLDAALTHGAVAADPGHKVDGVRPRLLTTGDGAPRISNDGVTVILTFDEPLSSMTAVPESFAVTVDNAARGVSAVAADGAALELTLVAAVASGETVTVAYTDPDASADDANAAQDAAGNDADSFSSAIGVRSLAEWEFTVTPSLPDPDDPTIMVATLTENGDPITATATITNGVAFTTDQTVTLEWGGLDLTTGVVVAAGNTTAITIRAGASTGSLQVRAPDTDTLPMYDPPLRFPLSATFGATEIGRVTLTRVDDDEVPVVKLEATPSTVAEGESITLAATLTLPFGFAAEVGAVELAVTDPHGALSGPPPPLSSGNAKATWTVTAADDVVSNEGARSITFELQRNPHFPFYTQGEPSSVTIEVLDNDMAPPVAPDAPRSLTVWASHQQVTLSWLAPLSDGGSEILRYQYRRKVGSGSFGAWTDIPNSAPGQANAGSSTVTGLTNEVAYTFKVRAQNVVGYSAASNEAAGTPRPLTTPRAPRDPRMSSGDGKLIVQWAAPSWDGGSPILRCIAISSGTRETPPAPSPRWRAWMPGLPSARTTCSSEIRVGVAPAPSPLAHETLQ